MAKVASNFFTRLFRLKSGSYNVWNRQDSEDSPVPETIKQTTAAKVAAPPSIATTPTEGEVSGDELEADVELPPPMTEIQTHVALGVAVDDKEESAELDTQSEEAMQKLEAMGLGDDAPQSPASDTGDPSPSEAAVPKEAESEEKKQDDSQKQKQLIKRQ